MDTNGNYDNFCQQFLTISFPGFLVSFTLHSMHHHYRSTFIEKKQNVLGLEFERNNCSENIKIFSRNRPAVHRIGNRTSPRFVDRIKNFFVFFYTFVHLKKFFESALRKQKKKERESTQSKERKNRCRYGRRRVSIVEYSISFARLSLKLETM